MNEPDSKRKISSNANLASFYYLAEDMDQIAEADINPSLHAVSQIAHRYESPEFIAKGGMKQVHKVYDARCKRNVAMATLHDDAPPELGDPLIHEAWLTAMLDHPNIITIHDVGVDNRHRPYFTMDLKSGDSLSQLLEKLNSGDTESCRRYPLENLLQMFVKICEAIAYAHSIQILHLDLKPANIQVGHYGEVLVCDWGLGRVQRRDDGIEFERLLLNCDLLGSNTLFGEVRGTLGYMAPEQIGIIGQNGERDTRTDIYQLGCILYSILTLKRPLEGAPDEAFEKALRGEIVPPRKRTPERNIPASLEAVVVKAMNVAPSARYQTVATLSEEVRRYLTGYATQAEDAGILTQLGLLYQRNKRFCRTVLCSGLVIVCGALWSYLQLAEKERHATRERQHAERTLALYEAGRSELDRMTARNADSVERAVIGKHLAADCAAARQLLKAALITEPDNPVYLRAMGEHYFIAQRFHQAASFLDRGEKRGNEPDQLICDLAHEYATIKPDDDKKLTTQQVVGLLHRIENFNGFEAMILLNDQTHRVDPHQRALIIEEHLRSLNPEWHDGWFEYDFANSRLRLGGKGLRRLSDSGSIVAGLQPKTLDISGSEIEALWKETSYAIETLDMRGCPLKNPHVLLRFLHLKQLIILPGQLKQEHLDMLPDWVEVIQNKL